MKIPPRAILQTTFLLFCVAILLRQGSGNENQTGRSIRPEIRYAPAQHLCVLENKSIQESSGLAISRCQKNVFWTHNDSGSQAWIYRFDSSGKDLGKFLIAGARSRDWEDMASFVLDGKPYLLFADVGDNGKSRRQYSFYLVAEPGENDTQAVLTQTVHFNYEGGSQNCESIAFDPTNRQVILITKEWSTTCQVFSFTWPDKSTKQPLVAKAIATIKIPIATAMDISPNGQRAIVSTYGSAYEYTRGPHEDWSKAFSRRGRKIALPLRQQGESICYGSDEKTLFLTSEKLPTPLWKIPVQ